VYVYFLIILCNVEIKDFFVFIHPPDKLNIF